MNKKEEDEIKNWKVYGDDWRKLSHMAIDENSNQMEIMHKLLQVYKESLKKP